jgi:hypothetical protein
MIATAFIVSPEQADSWITRLRLAPYLDATHGDRLAATELYVWNARLSAVCIEVIHHVEVLVRNAIHRQLRVGQMEDGLRSWLIDPTVLKPGELHAVDAAIMRIRRLHKPVTADRVVAGLQLSFWARLLGTRYDELWKSTLHRAFPHGSGNRKEIAGPMNRVSQLRNDIAHHTSILDVPVADRHADLLQLAAAVDPAAADWITGISQVEPVLAQAPACCTPDDGRYVQIR